MPRQVEKWELVAISQDRSVVCALPEDGTIVLGRGGAGAVDLAIDDPSVSRRHAVFEVRGETITVEDLGSGNGTRIVDVVAGAQRRAETLVKHLSPEERAVVPPTASVHLGEVTVLLRRAAALAARERHGDPEVIARSPAMKQVLGLLERIAQSPLSVLLVGERGVGKDTMARAMHAASPRSEGPFVAIDGAALVMTEDLLEAASGGTAFFDDIGELPLPEQTKLLSALEAEPGARIVSSTNRDLSEDEASFRPDLYLRLSGITLAIPPLRERREDLEPLAMLFAKRAADPLDRPPPTFSPEALVRLRGHTFPGNVRELRDVVERAVALAPNDVVEAGHLVFDGDENARG